MTKNVSLKELRPKLPRIMEDIDGKMDRFIVTKRGKPVALIMSIDDYESLLETMDILSNRNLMKKIKSAEKDIKNGDVEALDKIEKELGVV